MPKYTFESEVALPEEVQARVKDFIAAQTHALEAIKTYTDLTIGQWRTALDIDSNYDRESLSEVAMSVTIELLTDTDVPHNFFDTDQGDTLRDLVKSLVEVCIAGTGLQGKGGPYTDLVSDAPTNGEVPEEEDQEEEEEGPLSPVHWGGVRTGDLIRPAHAALNVHSGVVAEVLRTTTSNIYLRLIDQPEWTASSIIGPFNETKLIPTNAWSVTR